VRELAELIWGECDGISVTRREYGKGRIYWGESLRSILIDHGVGPDLAFTRSGETMPLDFIHRRLEDTDLYFVRNTTGEPISGTASFRQHGKEVEYWDPASGKIYMAEYAEDASGCMEIPLSLDAKGSLFLVFSPEMHRRGDAQVLQDSQFGRSLEERILTMQEIPGPWKVTFPESDAGAGEVVFDSLVYWNRRPEDGIRFFSGIATYEKEFSWTVDPTGQEQGVYLAFDDIVEVAHLYLNGADLGILWKKPFRAEITPAVQPGTNHLVVEVANTWANGLAGDARLPVGQRRTKTNVTRLPNAWAYPLDQIPNADYDLLEGGLSGTVKIFTFKSN
jgi:hypothetical protein